MSDIIQVHCLQQSFDPGWRRNARKGRKHSTADNRLTSGFMFFVTVYLFFSLHYENVLYLYKFVFPTVIILLYKQGTYSYCMYILYLSVKYIYINILLQSAFVPFEKKILTGIGTIFYCYHNVFAKKKAWIILYKNIWIIKNALHITLGIWIFWKTYIYLYYWGCHNKWHLKFPDFPWLK